MKKKYMVTACLSILMLISTLLFTACIPSFRYDYEELKNEVVKIEIIDLGENIYGGGNDFESKISQLLITIEDEEVINDVVLDISKLVYKQLLFGDPMWHRGICIKLYYKGGGYEILSLYMIARFDPAGKPVYSQFRSCSEKAFNALIEKYLD
ncbi:MAG: hypothetical protein FWE85_04785 [Clostridiales bacterium]|nr:hypothetical protein [Clostridiales bacterium]